VKHHRPTVVLELGEHSHPLAYAEQRCMRVRGQTNQFLTSLYAASASASVPYAFAQLQRATTT